MLYFRDLHSVRTGRHYLYSLVGILPSRFSAFFAYVLILESPSRFHRGKQIGNYVG